MKPGDRQAVHWHAKQLGTFSGKYESVESFLVRLNTEMCSYYSCPFDDKRAKNGTKPSKIIRKGSYTNLRSH